jgi:hypothetical protein
MDWILVGKSYLIVVIGTVSIHLIKGMLRLRRKYGLSFGMEDWVEWKDWFIYYLPYTIALLRWHFKLFWIAFFGAWVIDLFSEYYLGYSILDIIF